MNNLCSIEEVLEFTFPELERKLVQLGYEEGFARTLFKDVLRFLWIHSHEGEPFTPSVAIDEVWHEFILFTREYRDFCEQYLGRFVHHCPRPEGVWEIEKQRAIDVAGRLFPGIDLANWEGSPAAGSGCCDVGCGGCEDLNCDCEGIQNKFWQTEIAKRHRELASKLREVSDKRKEVERRLQDLERENRTALERQEVALERYRVAGEQRKVQLDEERARFEEIIKTIPNLELLVQISQELCKSEREKY